MVLLVCQPVKSRRAVLTVECSDGVKMELSAVDQVGKKARQKRSCCRRGGWDGSIPASSVKARKAPCGLDGLHAPVDGVDTQQVFNQVGNARPLLGRSPLQRTCTPQPCTAGYGGIWISSSLR
jgi:hypothetical protein